MSVLDSLLEKVTQAITQHGEAKGFDHSGLLGQITNIFTNHSPDDRGERSVLPASRDPYGDPGQQRSNTKPASQDPYGDPADEPSRR